MRKESTESREIALIMFPIEVISSITWNEHSAQNLKALRGKKTRQQIVDQLKKLYGVEISPQMLQKFEDGVSKTITPKTLTALCLCYGVRFDSVIESAVRIPIPRTMLKKISTES
jgi:DNA-binding Xre family transcriptional regulator